MSTTLLPPAGVPRNERRSTSGSRQVSPAIVHPPSNNRRDLSTVQDPTVTIQRGDVVVRALGVLEDGGAARVLAAVHCAPDLTGLRR